MAIKTISEGTKPSVKIHAGRCTQCGARYECTQADLTPLHDPTGREPSSAYILCRTEGCRRNVYMSPRRIKSTASAASERAGSLAEVLLLVYGLACEEGRTPASAVENIRTYLRGIIALDEDLRASLERMPCKNTKPKLNAEAFDSVKYTATVQDDGTIALQTADGTQTLCTYGIKEIEQLRRIASRIAQERTAHISLATIAAAIASAETKAAIHDTASTHDVAREILRINTGV